MARLQCIRLDQQGLESDLLTPHCLYPLCSLPPGARYWGAPCIGGDWVLAVARIFPVLIIFFMDTSLFYQV